MEKIEVPYLSNNGYINNLSILKIVLVCPYCKIRMIPEYIFLDTDNGVEGKYSVFCRCTNPDCNHSFISEYLRSDYSGDIAFNGVKPSYPMDKQLFSDIINEISTAFCEIYNQAYAAQQMKLTQICGVGYRKALEFLIKDYVISKDTSKEESIKKKNLGNCIEEDVSDEKIKQVAKRATWLGNDETHYVRKWDDKDVDDLVSIIKLTIHWIESEVETESLFESMPENQ